MKPTVKDAMTEPLCRTCNDEGFFEGHFGYVDCPECAEREKRELRQEIQRLEGVIASAAKWRDKPDIEGLYIVTDSSNLSDFCYLRPTDLAIFTGRVYGPIPDDNW